MIHGLFQVLEKALGQNKRQYDGPGKMVKIFITLFLITFAWIIFRMPTISDAFGVIAHIIEWQNQKGFFWPSYNNYFITFGETILLLTYLYDLNIVASEHSQSACHLAHDLAVGIICHL